MTFNEINQLIRDQAIADREAKAAAKGMTVAEYNDWEDGVMRKVIEESLRGEIARKRAAKAAAKATQGKGAPVKTLPSGPLRLESIVAWQCEACDCLQHGVSNSPLYQCKECEGYFNEENAAGDNSNKCPDCEKRGRKVGEYSCAECDQGPMQEVQAFFCPINGDACAPLEDEGAVATHLNDEHSGEFPGEWMDEEGDLILDGDNPPAPAAGSVICAHCGAALPGEESIGSEGKDYCFACAGVL